ncbi:hypothetical protein PENTCL1PPCAC_711, partial [Pristionchus entomophagus]
DIKYDTVDSLLVIVRTHSIQHLYLNFIPAFFSVPTIQLTLGHLLTEANLPICTIEMTMREDVRGTTRDAQLRDWQNRIEQQIGTDKFSTSVHSHNSLSC